jgi:hypothetical protein
VSEFPDARVLPMCFPPFCQRRLTSPVICWRDLSVYLIELARNADSLTEEPGGGGGGMGGCVLCKVQG